LIYLLIERLIGGWQKRTAAVGYSGMHVDVTLQQQIIFWRRFLKDVIFV
jgi:hypothetical protein